LLLSLPLSSKSSESLQSLEQDALNFAKDHGPILPLDKVISSQYPKMALAAEFKRASPSKGRMADADMSCGDQTAQYAQAGANVISVLTEPTWFQGSLQDLQDARMRTTSASSEKDRPAILRKEFVVNEYMIAEAAAHGADTVLLIVAVLPQHLLKRLIDYSRKLGMEPLVEVHALEELDVALEANAKVIGVNNRNLHTFQMDLNTTNVVAQKLSDKGLSYAAASDQSDNDTILCSLSGMSTADDVHRYRQIGVGMCLIGESLMRSPDPKLAIASLCLEPADYNDKQQQQSNTAAAYTRGTQIVKVCGITSGNDAITACRAGANWIGTIFVPKSKRCVTKEQATEIVQAVQSFGERQGSSSMELPTTANNKPLAHFQQMASVLEKNSKRPLVVGVFQNQSPEFIKEMVQECGLDLVQLHGKEGMAACAETGVPAIRVVDMEIGGDDDINQKKFVDSLLSEITTDPVAILLDTSIKGTNGGGTGQTFDWTLAEQVQNAGIPVLVAGGLKPDNIGNCISQVRPWGVDVSSGVESSPGQKDVEKIQKFCQTARTTAMESAKGF